MIRSLTRAAYCLLLLAITAWSSSADEIGVLVLAHGGSARWNQTVEEAVQQARLADPTEVAFGMGMRAHEAQAIQQAVDRLEGQGVSRLIVVPLLISSASEVMRQFQYLCGLRDHGPWEDDVKPVAVHVPLTMTVPLDADPLMAEVALARALELSYSPPEEAVVLVAHGPTDEVENTRWLEIMVQLAKQVQAEGRFRAVIPVTMRDDAPKPVQEAATGRIRDVIQREGQQGPVLVIPLLLAPGGIEEKIPQRLRGLSFRYQGRTLLPDARIARWIAQQVRRASTASEVRAQAPEAASIAPREPVAHARQL